MKEELESIEILALEEAGRLIHKNPEWIRAKIRQGVNWGDCTQVTPGQWSYVIIKSKFLEFAGIKENVEEMKQLQDDVFYTPTTFSELRDCSIPTAQAIFNSKDFPSENFGKEKVALGSAIRIWYSTRRKKDD